MGPEGRAGCGCSPWAASGQAERGRELLLPGTRALWPWLSPPSPLLILPCFSISETTVA